MIYLLYYCLLDKDKFAKSWAMKKDKIIVKAPATIANVSCGFDILGLAIERPFDVVTLEKNDLSKLVISSIDPDHLDLPVDINKNTASVAVSALLDSLDSSQGFDMSIVKGVPACGGMGSSAASAAAAVFAVNQLLGEPYSSMDLIQFAMEGERVAAGSAHADNVAPSILGGVTLIRSYDPLDIITLSNDLDLFCVVVHPGIKVKTKDARDVLPESVPLSKVVNQSGNVASLVYGITKGDLNIIESSMHDAIVEPVRASLIPGFLEMKQAALDAGAIGCSISGSGPSVFAFSPSLSTSEKISQSMQNIFTSLGIVSTVYISKVNNLGCEIIN